MLISSNFHLKIEFFNQFIVIFLVGVLLFTDFSKILKTLRNFIKNNEIYKTIKKKINSGKKGFEPLTFGFGNHRSTN